MQDFKEQISQNLIAYQRQVDNKLRELYSQGLLSSNDLQELSIDVRLTGQAILEAFESQRHYPEKVLKVYIDNLVDKYSSEVESKIASIEKKRIIFQRQNINESNQKIDETPNQSRPQNFLTKITDWLRGGNSTNTSSSKENRND